MNRLLSKLAAESEVRGDEARRTEAYTSVHEDSSTESTKQFTSAVEFRKKSNEISDVGVARQYLKDGLVIAYPTEAVYGFGCDPFNKKSVYRILTLKNRAADKGLILLVSNWDQLDYLAQDLSDEDYILLRKSWPGPTTFIFPKSKHVPQWISGNYETIAIRMPAHSISSALCKEMPIVSTSANAQS
ncbi:MAG: threonylcarbamoyl-AMP synthase, partial [Legionellales bacterium RIFCSPHIGHO2_12_FULL_35_11]